MEERRREQEEIEASRFKEKERVRPADAISDAKKAFGCAQKQVHCLVHPLPSTTDVWLECTHLSCQLPPPPPPPPPPPSLSHCVYVQQEQEEEELRKRMSHHSLNGSDDSDSESNQTPPLSTSAPSSSSHLPILPNLTTSVSPVSHLTMVDQSGNPSGQLPDGVGGGRRGRLKRQIQMQRGKCLG